MEKDVLADLTEESCGLSKLHLSDIALLQTEQKCKKQLECVNALNQSKIN